ncbi:MAG: hypothetical protein IKM48_06775 [Clostridia bacterium]|nr:hypothetical protein [Clostridia bacterium]MBR6794037.1 hypothetical protein [Clostridia bacterium]
MKICTFFGHRDAGEDIKPRLRQAIIDVIEKDGVRHFYVGSQGRFDRMAISALKELAPIYSIRYEVVLAYLDRQADLEDVPTFFPEGQEEVLPRFAIDRRNRWMVEQSDYVISYTYKIAGGAVKFTRYAEKKGKVVIKI